MLVCHRHNIFNVWWRRNYMAIWLCEVYELFYDAAVLDEVCICVDYGLLHHFWMDIAIYYGTSWEEQGNIRVAIWSFKYWFYLNWRFLLKRRKIVSVFYFYYICGNNIVKNSGLLYNFITISQLPLHRWALRRHRSQNLLQIWQTFWSIFHRHMLRYHCTTFNVFFKAKSLSWI